jgi:hypothetical protein
MAYAGSLKVNLKYAEDADYTENVGRSSFSEVTSVPTKKIDFSVGCASGGTAVIAASRYTTIQKLGIQNTDASAYVTVTYNSVLGPTACTVVLGPGDVTVLPNVVATTAVTITASTGTVVCKLFGYGT